MASLDEAFKFSLMVNNAKWTNQGNESIDLYSLKMQPQQKLKITIHEAANIIADQHRFPVKLLKAKNPSDTDGCYHFINVKNGYDYCYKY